MISVLILAPNLNKIFLPRCTKMFKSHSLTVRRSSLSQMFFKKDFKLKFRKFYKETPVLESLFNKVSGLKACNFIKKRIQHSCFPLKFARFLIGKHMGWSLSLIKLQVWRPVNLLKRDSNPRPVNFAKVLGTTFHRIPPMAASDGLKLKFSVSVTAFEFHCSLKMLNMHFMLSFLSSHLNIVWLFFSKTFTIVFF